MELEDGDELSCIERLEQAQDDGFCTTGMSIVFGAGEREPVEPVPFELVEFEGGRYQRGYDAESGEFFYNDESCLIACRRAADATHSALCEGVDDEGNTICGFATSAELTLEACIEFTEACR